jgi:hypothetical protein
MAAHYGSVSVATFAVAAAWLASRGLDVEPQLAVLLAVMEIPATLAASASYIAVPAAMRIAVPEANPAISLAGSLGVTFPFNILLGIPLYHWMASQWMKS